MEEYKDGLEIESKVRQSFLDTVNTSLTNTRDSDYQTTGHKRQKKIYVTCDMTLRIIKTKNDLGSDSPQP